MKVGIQLGLYGGKRGVILLGGQLGSYYYDGDGIYMIRGGKEGYERGLVEKVIMKMDGSFDEVLGWIGSWSL